MRFGCCAELNQMKLVQDAGYDYIELPVKALTPECSECDFEKTMQEILKCDILPEVWHHLLENDMKVVGPETDPYRVERYVRTAFKRIEELGGEIVVFGSAEARRVPEGFSQDEAIDQIVEFLSLAGQIAGQHGLCVAVEPLSTMETNMINSFKQATDIVRLIGHPFVKVLADYYQMSEIGEPLSSLMIVGEDIVHAHTADKGRRTPGSGNLPQGEFLISLHAAGYDDRISVQSIFDDPAVDIPAALEHLKNF